MKQIERMMMNLNRQLNAHNRVLKYNLIKWELKRKQYKKRLNQNRRSRTISSDSVNDNDDNGEPKYRGNIILLRFLIFSFFSR